MDYALAAEVMCVRRPGAQDWSAPAGLTFRDWLRGAGDRPPTGSDLSYHLSTLFPPVRPRGHLEVRGIDAQPGDGWMVPLAVTAALLDDPLAAEQAMAAAEALLAPAREPLVARGPARPGPPRDRRREPPVLRGGGSGAGARRGARGAAAGGGRLRRALREPGPMSRR